MLAYSNFQIFQLKAIFNNLDFAQSFNKCLKISKKVKIYPYHFIKLIFCFQNFQLFSKLYYIIFQNFFESYKQSSFEGVQQMRSQWKTNLIFFGYLTRSANGIYINLKVNPQSKRTKITGRNENEIYVDICKPAQNNEANQELVDYFDRQFGLRTKIVKGMTSKHKTLFMLNKPDRQVNLEEIFQNLLKPK